MYINTSALEVGDLLLTPAGEARISSITKAFSKVITIDNTKHKLSFMRITLIGSNWHSLIAEEGNQWKVKQ